MLEISAVFIVCLTLAIGAAVRMACGRLRIPYTVAMLLAGLLIGLAAAALSGWGRQGEWLEMLARGAAVSPDLILFVFIPALIFESAFAIEVYAFRKNLGAVALLAGPGLVLGIVLIGGLMAAGTAVFWQWGLPAALLFAALISATDPVAVVALLREVGAPKRLGLLIEGESLINDGTAIVAFTMLSALVAGTLDSGPIAVIGELAWVTGGGIAVGAALGIFVSRWLERTFNSPLVEITLTIVLAYASMLVAESLLHVSGVMAVVAAGLWMSGPGRTNISPEVSHFLHRFWEMLSYLANTLIFFLVGLIISTGLGRITLPVVAMILFAYAGTTAIRFLVVFCMLPLINRVSDPITRPAAAVMAWGGLRGAVSMALALVVSRNEALPQELRDQILLVTAGVVLLSILINGTTIGRLLRLFGLDRQPASERLAHLTAAYSVLKDVERRIDRAAEARDLRTVNWQEVRADLERQQQRMSAEIVATEEELNAASPEERARGYKRQVLYIERGAYRAAFAQGMLSRRAARILEHGVDVHLDRLDRGETRLDRDWTDRARPWRFIVGPGEAAALGIGRRQFDRLSLRYELRRGESLAANHVLEELNNMPEMDSSVRDEIAASYRDSLHRCRKHIEDLRTNLPEVTQAIETRLARRIQLNFERDRYEELCESGVLDPQWARAVLDSVEERMKGLRHGVRSVELPGMAELCRNTPLFAALDAETVRGLSERMNKRILSPGEVLFSQGDVGDAMFIIARGAMEILCEIDGRTEVLDVLGGGEILGEMALISGEPRSATVRAVTTVTLGELTRDDFDELMATRPRLAGEVQRRYLCRQLEDCLRKRPDFRTWTPERMQEWFEKGETRELRGGERVSGDAPGFLFLATGRLRLGAGEEVIDSPALLVRSAYSELIAFESSWITELPPASGER